jgi:hypothetical protein
MLAYLDPKKAMPEIPLLQPFGDTPLLTSVISVSTYLIERKRGGLLIVICDGAFNDEGKNERTKYNRIVELYEGNPDLALNLVAFDIDDDAEKKVLQDLAENARGKFYEAATSETLMKVAEDAMTPRKFKVVRDAEPAREWELDLGSQVKDLRPYNKYNLRFQGIPDFLATISGGERLVFELESTNKQFVHRRPSLKNSVGISGNRLAERNEPTRFGYLKAEFEKKNKVATFWLGLDREDPSGMVERPKEIRIDVSRKGAASRQFSGSWKLAPDQSIPVWEINFRDWPAEPEPQAEINAFWKMTRTIEDTEMSLEKLIKTKRETGIAVKEWLANSLTVAAEWNKQEGKVLVKLESNANPVGSTVSDIRVELGELSPVEQRFEPIDFDWTSKCLQKKGGGGKITYTFDVGEKDVSKLRIALTSITSLRRDASELQSKLAIENWDDKLN